ncbi:hypothetical protein OA416_02380 [Paracoccaceae bacterium]|nr:hypothetical protein [Paracoccaceae bacterium]
MSNFDKMIKLIEEKDIKEMEELLHRDFLFVVDSEMETREEWLKEAKRLLDEDEFLILNIKLLYEDEKVIVHQGQYDVEGTQRIIVTTTHLREGRPWGQLVNRLAVG